MNGSSQGTAGSAGNSRRMNTPPIRSSPQPPALSSTSPTNAPGSRPSSAPKAQKQPSNGQLSTKAMSSAKSFESSRSARGASSRDSLISRPPKTPEAPSSSNAKEERLKILESSFDSLRNIITCKICYGLLYEPYTTNCGHTYCYVCFCKSFQPKQIPACPECRGKLLHPPAPAYAVREMTHAFISQSQLLPEGETLEQHKQWQKEHADIIQADKDNNDAREGGLWRGFFRRRVPRRNIIRDFDDDVIRCPNCMWELEDGMCQRCGLPFDENGNGDWEFSDMASEHPSMISGADLVIEDYDIGEYDVEDDFIDDDEEEIDWQGYEEGVYDEDPIEEQPFSIRRYLNAQATGRGAPSHGRPRAAHSAAGGRSRYSASVHESEMGTLEEEDEDEEDTSLNNFVVNDVGHRQGFHSSETSTSESRSERAPWPESIAEDDEEEEEDDDPVVSNRRRFLNTQSSTSTLGVSQRPSQMARRRRVVSESPSEESAATSASASRGVSAAPTTSTEEGEQDDDDDDPVPSGSRRRQREHSSEEPTRRVRPRPRGNSQLSSDDVNPWSYRPIGTPQIGDGEDEQSDGGRTAVGWEPIIHLNEQPRNTGSLTTTADSPTAPARPYSRTSSSRFPLGSRGIRRRPSNISVNHYEDNDADDDGSDTQQNTTQSQLNRRSSRIRLDNPVAQILSASTPVAQVQVLGSGTESDDTETSPRPNRLAQNSRRRREYDPVISMILAQHQTEMSTQDPEGPVYAEFEHLRGIARTPVARPRTSNRTRPNANPQAMMTTAPLASPNHGRVVQRTYTPSRSNRNSADLSSAHVHPTVIRPVQPDRMLSSSRIIATGSSPAAATTRLRTVVDSPYTVPNAPINESLASVRVNNSSRPLPADSTQLRAMHASANGVEPVPVSPSRPMIPTVLSSPSPRGIPYSEIVERPHSRVGYRGGQMAPRPPSTANRTPVNAMRPQSGGSRRGSVTRSPFSPPQISPGGVGLNTARTWQTNNPFFNSIRPRQSNQRLRHEPSSQTLRQRPSVRILRVQPLATADVEPDQDSPHLRPSASRMHLLRPQASSRRLQVQRDVVVPTYQPGPAPTARRTSPSTSSTLSEDERSRRANELVRTRLEQLAQQQRSSPAAIARAEAAAQQARQQIEQRLASTMGRTAERQNAGASTGTGSNIRSSPLNPGLAPRSAVSAINSQAHRTSQAMPPNTSLNANTTGHAQQGPQRASIQPPGVSAQLPRMAEGIAAITTGGDTRRN